MAERISQAQGFLGDVERAVSAGAGNEEQLNAFGKFRTDLEERIKAVEELRTEVWPAGKTEEIVARQHGSGSRLGLRYRRALLGGEARGHGEGGAA